LGWLWTYKTPFFELIEQIKKYYLAVQTEELLRNVSLMTSFYFSSPAIVYLLILCFTTNVVTKKDNIVIEYVKHEDFYGLVLEKQFFSHHPGPYPIK
jgi:hypothetical protein